MRFEHVGLSCRDMAKQVAFYRDLLGLRERQHETPPDGSTTILLDAEGGGGLELIHRPEIVDAPARPLPENEAGVRHFCFAVDSMGEVRALLEGADIPFIVEPRRPKVMKGAAWIAFCKDPEGNIVEFVEKMRG